MNQQASSSTSALVCALVVLLLGANVATAQWSYVAYGQQLSVVVFNDLALAFDSQTMLRVSYRNIATQKLVKYLDTLGSSKKVIPIACVSTTSTTRTDYGWNRWKHKLVSAVQVDTSTFTSFQIALAAVPGYAITSDETISCPLQDEEGNKYYTPESTIFEPAMFSFTVRYSNTPPSLTMKGSNTDSGGNVISVYEKDIRRNGLRLTLQLLLDDWLVDRRQFIYDGLVSTRDCLRSILQVSDLNITEENPHKVVIDLPSERTATFNIDPDIRTEVQFVPSTQMSFKGVVPAASPDSLTFQIIAEKSSPNVVLVEGGQPIASGIQVVAESCIRLGTGCTTFLVINIIGRDGQKPCDFCNFELTEMSIPDVKRLAFNGPAEFQAIKEKFVHSMLLPQGQVRTLQINFNAVPEFDVGANATITIDLPFSVFQNLEPPIVDNPLMLIVVPSPGTASGTFRDLDEDALWSSEITFNITLSGESWKQDEARASIVDMTSVETIAVNPLFGWAALKHQILPPSAITFPTKSTMTLSFNRVLDFDIDKNERITFTVPPSMMRSGLPAALSQNSFSISAVPGMFVVSGRSSFEEEDMWNGEFRLDLVLAGESWTNTNFAACIDEMVGLWVSNFVSEGLASDSNRKAILSNFTRIDRRTVMLVAPPHEAYEISRTELLTLHVPASCTLSGAAPRGAPIVTIYAHRAVIDIYMLTSTGAKIQQFVDRTMAFDPSGGDANSSTSKNFTFAAFSEGRIRPGGRIVFELTYDSLSVSNAAVVKNNLWKALKSTNGVESTGWNDKINCIVPSAFDIVISNNNQRIEIPLSRCVSYDISVEELIDFSLQPSWMVSQRSPETDTRFIIYVAPGSVELTTWSGATVDVTEVDVRSGTLFFNFTLIGDSWRRQRKDYVDSIVANDTAQPFGMYTLSEQVLPDVDFFSFTYDDGRDILVLRFQAAGTYDIFRDEIVSFKFAPRTMLSQTSPLFLSPDGRDLDRATFHIRAAPGMIYISGTVINVNEKMFRRGGIIVFLTLFGESFAVDAIELILQGLHSTVATSSPSGFNQLRSKILPIGTINATDYKMTLRFTAERTFDIAQFDQLVISLQPAMFRSGILPEVKSPLSIGIDITGGELRFQLVNFTSGSNVVPEWYVRQYGLVVRLSLDGDQWREKALQNRPASFLLGFSSSASLLAESHGFSANYMDILGLQSPTVKYINDGTVEVFLCGNCSEVNYDISDDEVITFSLRDPIYVMSGIVPDPASVSFTVQLSPRTIMFVIDEDSLKDANSPLWPEGYFTLKRFQLALSNLMSIPLRRIVSVEHREAGIMVEMYFTGPLASLPDATVTEAADTRTSTLLTETLFALDEDFLFSWIFMSQMYLSEDGPPAAQPVATKSPWDRGGDDSGIMSGPYGTAIWAGIFVVFLLLAVGLMFCHQYSRRASLPGGLRSGSLSSRAAQNIVGTAPNTFNDDDDAAGLDPLKIFAGQKTAVKRMNSSKSRRLNPLVSSEIVSLKEVARERVRAEMERKRDHEAMGLPARRILLPPQIISSEPLPLNSGLRQRNPLDATA